MRASALARGIATRWLDMHGQHEVIQRFFGLESGVSEVLFWGCDPDGRSPIQQWLNIKLRKLDGRRKGTMTEPDLVIVTGTEVCFVECKLLCVAEPWSNHAPRETPPDAGAGTTPQQPAADTTQPEPKGGWKGRWADYRQFGNFGNWPPASPSQIEHGVVYQLFRNAIYSSLLAQHLNKRAKLNVLLSEQYPRAYPAALHQYERFRGMRHTSVVTAPAPFFWERLSALLPHLLAAKLRRALEVVRARVLEYVQGHARQLRSQTEAKRNTSKAILDQVDLALFGQLLPHLLVAFKGKHVPEASRALALALLQRPLVELRGQAGPEQVALKAQAVEALASLGPKAAAARVTLEAAEQDDASEVVRQEATAALLRLSD